MGREVCFHELLIFICAMWLREVLFENHITVFCKHFALVNRQTLCFLSLQNVAHNDFVQNVLILQATIHASFEINQGSEASCSHAKPNHTLSRELIFENSNTFLKMKMVGTMHKILKFVNICVENRLQYAIFGSSRFEKRVYYGGKHK